MGQLGKSWQLFLDYLGCPWMSYQIVPGPKIPSSPKDNSGHPWDIRDFFLDNIFGGGRQ